MNLRSRSAVSPFPATRWTLVAAVRSGSPADAAKAMEEICRDYWYPIYAFLRRSGHAAHDAEDLTQAFFERLITQESLNDARRERGKLRCFLLGVLKRLLCERARHLAAQKRGGAHAHVSFDAMEAETRYASEPKDTRDPERIFAAAWARKLFDTVLGKLRASPVSTLGGEGFDLLLPFLISGDEPPSYREVAGKLSSTEAAARIRVFRLRTKFRDLLREEVAGTVLDKNEIEGELTWLKSALAGP